MQKLPSLFHGRKASQCILKVRQKKAGRLYPEGSGLSAMQRSWGVSNVTIIKWRGAFGKEVKISHSDYRDIELAEPEKMPHYVGNKKTAIGSGWPLIDPAKSSPTRSLVSATIKRQSSYGML